MYSILLKEIARRQVGTSAERPGARSCAIALLGISIVGMGGWYKWITGMDDQADAGNEEGYFVFNKLPTANSDCLSGLSA